MGGDFRADLEAFKADLEEVQSRRDRAERELVAQHETRVNQDPNDDGVGSRREEDGGYSLPTIFSAARIPFPLAGGKPSESRASAPDAAWPPPVIAGAVVDPNTGSEITNGQLRDQAIDHARDPYTTRLSPSDEATFQKWSAISGLKPTPEYDMRGYWNALLSGEVDPPPHGSEHVLPLEWVTPRDVQQFSTSSRYYPGGDGSIDVIDQRFPPEQLDMQGNWIPPVDTQEIAAVGRTGHRRRSDAHLKNMEDVEIDNGLDSSTWSNGRPIASPAPVTGTPAAERPPVRQRSHPQPRGR